MIAVLRTCSSFAGLAWRRWFVSYQTHLIAGDIASESAPSFPDCHDQANELVTASDDSNAKPANDRYTRVSGLTRSEAEELLRWVESSGYAFFELTFVADEGFTVRYQ